MDEDMPQQESEKPRFLLPEGCKDLIDAFPRPEATGKTMVVFDQDGHSIGSPKVISEPESVPMGLAALPRHVSRLFTSAIPFGSLMVFTADDQRGFGLVRQDIHTRLFFSAPAPGGAALEHRVRAFFTVRALTPIHDYLANDGATRCIDYLLPPSLDAVTTICRELLIDCFGVQPNQTLHFLFDRNA